MRSALRPAALSALAALLLLGCGSDAENALLLPARRGDLEEVLRLTGSLRPLKEQNVRSPHWGEIRLLAPNGSPVKKGDVVLELDSEGTRNAIRDHQTDVKVAATELRQVEKEVEKSRRWAKLRLDAAKLNHQLEASKFAELKARPTPRELTEAESRLKLSETLVEAAADSLKLIRELVESGFAPAGELRSAELELAQARADLASAQAALRSVKTGPTASELQEAQIRVQQALLAQRSAANSIQITRQWTDAKLARFKRKLERENEKLREAQRRLREYQARAPSDGVVLHAKMRWGGVWQAGRHVWQGATVLSIPDMSRMKLTIQVPDSSVRQLEALGEVSARVRTKAVPDKVFTGRLERISAIGRDEFEQLDHATSGKLGRAERQVFEAEVVLVEKDERLLPGFSAEADLILRKVTDAIIVPRVALVFTSSLPSDAGAPAPPPDRPKRSGRGHGPSAPPAPRSATVYVRSSDGGFEPRSVSVVAANRLEAAVEGKLREGEMLYPGLPPGYSPPPAAAPAAAPGEDAQ
ncbi:MAG: HlyD family secretion protein [Planctomycetota bacterium]